MGEELASTLLDGSVWVGIPIAMLAGLVSFLSPCVLPLLPGYFGYVSGFVSDDAPSAGHDRQRLRLMAGVALFVLGFSVIFVALGAGFGVIGWWLYAYQDLILRVSGVLLIVLGLVFVGQLKFLQGSARISAKPRVGLVGAPLLGALFGLSWTACTGPVLAAIMAMSAGSGSPLQGAVLALFFCFGLGIPFLLVAAGFGWAAKSVGWAKRHLRGINIAGGVLLIALGVLFLSGLWMRWMGSLQGVIGGFETII